MPKWILLVVLLLAAVAGIAALIGSRLPREHVAAVRATYAAPPAALWALMGNPSTYASWRTDAKSIELLPPVDGKPAWRETTSNGAIDYVMAESDPGGIPSANIQAVLDAAWQKADAYANERRQMRAPVRAHPGQAADLISEHPAVQRILDSQRAWVLGGRVLAYQTGIELDIAKTHPDATRRAAAERWCSLLTPVLKAACTDQAFNGASG